MYTRTDQNPYNATIAQKHYDLSRAFRWAWATQCDPSGEPLITRARLREQLRSAVINADVAGDNILLPASPGPKDIYEFCIWNVASQTIVVQQGYTGANPIRLFQLTEFTDTTGLLLGSNGNFEMPHWTLDSFQPLVMNLNTGTQVDGYIRYRTRNGQF